MEITNLQIDRLKPSPGQPPDRMKDVGSLAESIKVIGILNALTVRELHEKGKPNGSHYEIVAGHRRFAAARVAGLTEVPCVIVPVDADQAQIIRITENVHRVNLTPMQEAEAIQALADRKWEYSKIAAELGMTPQQVARRARLLSLSKDWQKAMKKGEGRVTTFSAATLEFVARYNDEIQDAMLEEFQFDDEPTMDELKRFVSHFDHSLKSAPWKLDDELLLSKAGACTNCPKRSSSQPLLFFDDEKSAAEIKNDSCLDTDCWSNKQTAYFARKVAALEKEHPNLQIVATTHEGTRGRSDVIASHNYNRCTKGDKGAKPAIVVDGNEVGKLIWIKTSGGGSSSSGTKKVKGEKSGPITDKDRVERLTNRRSMHLVQQVIELLRKKNAEPDGLIANAVADSDGVDESQITMLKASVAIALAFGLREEPYDYRARGRKTDWVAVQEFCKSTPQGLCITFWQRFAPEMAGELFGRAANGAAATKIIKDLPPLLKIMGVKIEDLQAKAAADIPDRHGLLAQKGTCRECGAKCDVRMTICGACADKSFLKKKRSALKKSAAKKPAAPKPGICSECGCTEPNACVDKNTGETCSWADDSQTLCSFCAKAAKPPTKKPRGPKKASPSAPKGSFMAPLQPSPELAVIVGSDPLPRTEVTKKVWAYIKKNGLQDLKKRQVIHLDDVLKPIVGGGTSINMFRLSQAWAKHLTPVPVAKDAK